MFEINVNLNLLFLFLYKVEFTFFYCAKRKLFDFNCQFIYFYGGLLSYLM
jgi:hypothetical protein